MAEEAVDTRSYLVVLNDEEQYSIWLADRELPLAGGPRAPRAAGRSAWRTSGPCGPTCGR